jgi:hypothetical protein
VPENDIAAFQPGFGVSHWLATGRFNVHNIWSSARFFDDDTLPVDRCDASRGLLPDVPATPAAFESWLGSAGLTIQARADVTVDGRIAVRYDTEPADCPAPTAESSQSLLGGRFYLVPTPRDTILVNVYGDSETELQVLDKLIQSITFE